MAKYKCKVCGYVHEGNKAPDTVSYTHLTLARYVPLLLPNLRKSRRRAPLRKA